MLNLIKRSCLFFVVFVIWGYSTVSAQIHESWPYCSMNGGHGEGRENADRSQYSVCIFEDGSECEMFSFYYGECSPASTSMVWKGSVLPTFSDYPAKSKARRYSGEPVLDDGLAYLFKIYDFDDQLKKELARTPDFAGHFILSSFGHCGTGCQNFLIIDKWTGKVVMPEILLFNGIKKYEQGSRLLILEGLLDEDSEQVGTHYFVWSQGQLLPLKLSK